MAPIYKNEHTAILHYVEFFEFTHRRATACGWTIQHLIQYVKSSLESRRALFNATRSANETRLEGIRAFLKDNATDSDSNEYKRMNQLIETLADHELYMETYERELAAWLERLKEAEDF